MKDFYTLSDAQLVKRIGNKLKSVRLKRNITQQSLAEASSISVSSLKKIESGEIGTFDSLLRVLRTLGMLESIATLFEEEQMSPSEYYEMVNKSKKQTRKRAVVIVLKCKGCYHGLLFFEGGSGIDSGCF